MSRRRLFFRIAIVVMVVLVFVTCGFLGVSRWRRHSGSATLLVVDKGQRTVTVYRGEKVLAVLPLAIGKSPGPKRRQGDNCTPEGI